MTVPFSDPDWVFGDVVRLRSTPNEVFAMVVGWQSRVSFNPGESVVVLAVIAGDTIVGTADPIIRPYCGWWEPVA